MVQFLTTPVATVVISLAVLAVLVAAGVYAIGKVREDMTGNSPGASDLISKFRDLHSQGGLSDEEYRTIKAMLAERMEKELKISNKADNNLKAKDTVGPANSGPSDAPA